MTSKKYIIQPLTPPRSRRSKAKNSNGAGEFKKRGKESSAPTLPFSPDNTYDGEFDNPLDRRETTPREKPPPELETDLNKLRDYLKNESNFASSSDTYLHPFQYIDGEEDARVPESPSNGDEDFVRWIKDMHTKLVTKKRQVRTERREVDRAARKEAKDQKEKEKEQSSPTIPLSICIPVSPSISPHPSPSTPSSSNASPSHKQSRTLFPQLGRKNKNKVTFLNPEHKDDYESSKDDKSQNKASAGNLGPAPLFQTVRTHPIAITEDHPPLTPSSSASFPIPFPKSVSLSPRRDFAGQSRDTSTLPPSISPRREFAGPPPSSSPRREYIAPPAPQSSPRKDYSPNNSPRKDNSPSSPRKDKQNASNPTTPTATTAPTPATTPRRNVILAFS